jgi:hypothetical protein
MSTAKSTTRIAVEYREITRFVGYRFGNDETCWTRWKQVGLGNGGGTKSVLTNSWTLLPGWINTDGYRRIKLKTDDNPRGSYLQLHRLMLEAFVGPCPPGLEACHRPGAPKSSCKLEDLRWDTHPANIADKVVAGTDQSGERNARSKLTWKKVDRIRRLRRQGMRLNAVAAQYGLHRTTITRICQGETWIRRP